MSSDIILEIENITKRFPGVVALDQVNLKVRRGEVHAIVGENGAGKSTLMKIIAGAYRKDDGDIFLNQKKVDLRSPVDAQKLGISIIYQEFNLAPHLSAAANIFIGREPLTKFPVFIDKKKIREDSKKIFRQLGVDIDPDEIVNHLGVCEQQITEIAKALSFDSCLLIMDEPTSALPEHEVEMLYDVIRRIKEKGVTILFISHNLDDVYRIADTITVLRDGKHISTCQVSDVTMGQVVSMMVGQDISGLAERCSSWQDNDVLLETRNLCSGNSLKNINMQLHKGEILGIAGLLGAGRSELLRCIFGADPMTGGEIYIEGVAADIHCPADGVRSGIGFVPEDRKQQGLFLELATRFNVSTASLAGLSRFSIIDRRAEAELTENYIKSLSIRLSNQQQIVNYLSGGNQQKVLIARWLAINPKILLLDDPTRGIDIGARLSIHKLIHKLADSGLGVVFVSSELPEVMEVSDRILVMAKGRITADYLREYVTKEKIIASATGLVDHSSFNPDKITETGEPAVIRMA